MHRDGSQLKSKQTAAKANHEIPWANNKPPSQCPKVSFKRLCPRKAARAISKANNETDQARLVVARKSGFESLRYIYAKATGWLLSDRYQHGPLDANPANFRRDCRIRSPSLYDDDQPQWGDELL